MDPVASLALQLEWGADEALAERPLDRRTELAPQTSVAVQLVPPAMPVLAPIGMPASQAEAVAQAAQDLLALQAAMASFKGCALRETAMNLVFADGNPKAGLMLVVESPGPAEDRTGSPLAGPHGAFLLEMLASIGLGRDGIYAASVLPWRPPGDRKPSDLELQICLPFLRRHIALAQPRRLVTVGALAARLLLAPGAAGARRSQAAWQTAGIEGISSPIPVLALGSPTAVKATPHAKRATWAALLVLRRALDDEALR